MHQVAEQLVLVSCMVEKQLVVVRVARELNNAKESEDLHRGKRSGGQALRVERNVSENETVMKKGKRDQPDSPREERKGAC